MITEAKELENELGDKGKLSKLIFKLSEPGETYRNSVYILYFRLLKEMAHQNLGQGAKKLLIEERASIIP
jgi:hypothetical protein